MEEETPEKEEQNQNPKPRESTVDDIVFTLKPLVAVEYLFGIFKYRCVNNMLVKPTRWMRFLGLMITLSFTTAFWYFIRLPEAIGSGTVFVAIFELPSYVVLFQYICSVTMKTFFHNDATIRIYKSIMEVDNTLYVNFNKDFYRKSRRSTIINLCVLIACHLVTSITDNLTKKRIDYFRIIVVLLYVEQYLELFVFCRLIHMLKERLRVINDYLAKFVFEQNKRSTVFTVSKKDVVTDNQYNFIGKAAGDNMKLRELAITYDRIGETCAMINESFNFQIFMDLLSTFVYIVVSIWTVLYYIRASEDVTEELVTIIVWSWITVLSVAVLAFSCEALLTTRRNTRILVNEIIMDYDLPKIMRVQAKAFMELIEAWPLRIFVYDMFSVDITLMLKFISVATTFLIVVIQVSHLV